jgi:hypothetical protein
LIEESAIKKARALIPLLYPVQGLIIQAFCFKIERAGTDKNSTGSV